MKVKFEINVNEPKIKKEVEALYAEWDFPNTEIEKAYKDYTVNTFIKRDVIAQILPKVYTDYADFKAFTFGQKSQAGYYVFVPDFKTGNPLDIAMVVRNINDTINTYELPLEVITLAKAISDKKDIKSIAQVPESNVDGQSILTRLSHKGLIVYTNEQGVFKDIVVEGFGNLLQLNPLSDNNYAITTFNEIKDSKIADLIPIEIKRFVYNIKTKEFSHLASFTLPKELIDYLASVYDNYMENKEEWFKENNNFVRVKKIQTLTTRLKELEKEIQETKDELDKLDKESKLVN